MPPDVTREAVLFDLYSTLIDIRTDEVDPKVWEKLALFLSYRGASADPNRLSHSYWGLIEQSQRDSPERYPEIDIVAVFGCLLNELGLPDAVALATDVTRLFRTLSMVHFGVFPEVLPALRRFREHFWLGIVSNAQPLFLGPELARAGLAPLMDTVVVSGNHGFRKPDPRLFQIALARLRLPPERATSVGDNVEFDICGAKAARIRAVLIDRDGQSGDYVGECGPDRTICALDELYEWLVTDREEPFRTK